MDTFVYVIFAIVVVALVALLIMLALRLRRIPDIAGLEQKLLFALASQASVREIQDMLRGLPHSLVQSITGSLSKRTGKLNELMATMELTQYDRLFYLGEPIDFVGIKYDEGVDFIEVKSGKGRLSKDEEKLRDLIDTGRVNYVQLKVERIGLAEEVEPEE